MFSSEYGKVKGIVEKTRREYYLKGWEKSDWHQEGMLVFYQLLQEYPGLKDSQNLYGFFKVRFRNYIKDKLRQQASQKRTFDRLPHEEIGDLSHCLRSPGLLQDDLLTLRDGLRNYYDQLAPLQQANYMKLIRGERFKGRQEMLKELREVLKDFG
ncbi:sigma-70 family RNA polymerase sigma factor [Streptococcus suis]|nr:sigma-70 family RNA polymerase sigma factor [Streptococcus suis]